MHVSDSLQALVSDNNNCQDENDTPRKQTKKYIKPAAETEALYLQLNNTTVKRIQPDAIMYVFVGQISVTVQGWKQHQCASFHKEHDVGTSKKIYIIQTEYFTDVITVQLRSFNTYWYRE